VITETLTQNINLMALIEGPLKEISTALQRVSLNLASEKKEET